MTGAPSIVVLRFFYLWNRVRPAQFGGWFQSFGSQLYSIVSQNQSKWVILSGRWHWLYLLEFLCRHWRNIVFIDSFSIERWRATGKYLYTSSVSRRGGYFALVESCQFLALSVIQHWNLLQGKHDTLSSSWLSSQASHGWPTPCFSSCYNGYSLCTGMFDFIWLA